MWKYHEISCVWKGDLNGLQEQLTESFFFLLATSAKIHVASLYTKVLTKTFFTKFSKKKVSLKPPQSACSEVVCNQTNLLLYATRFSDILTDIEF